MKEKLIQDILDIEWVMFSSVPDGDKAACKKNPTEFTVMRKSQFETWPENILQSYYNDLNEAVAANRNLMTEKYARMMGLTRYLDHGGVIRELPAIEPEALELVQKINALFMEWNKALFQLYPRLVTSGRPLYACDDTPYQTSIETYLKGELITYSLQTLRLFYAFTLLQKEEGVNLPEQILLNTVKAYGYGSLAEAESSFR